MQRSPGLTAGDRMLALATLSFDMAVPEVMLPLVTGARTVLMPREDAADAAMLIRMLEQQEITVMQATPTTCYLLLDGGWRPPRGFKLWAGAEPLPPALAAKLLATGIDLWNLYGPTETTVWSTMGPITSVGERVSIGAPIDNTTVWILGDDDQSARPARSARSASAAPAWPPATSSAPNSTRSASSPTPSHPDGRCIAPGIWAAGRMPARSNTWGGRTIRSRSAATASSWERSSLVSAASRAWAAASW
ncbi:AMP-binding protein [Piscinibacter aquaticus]|uniref:AMP-binding protein n=1 Tax=Piscinibacter aquaticus TaxID=392597 RepID=A0A5C6U456_9BURK|nr:AMP-binding protein [Piscinibacter aquaticus]